MCHMGTITTRDGTEIFYKDWGKGQPIAFSHGWPLSADDWDAQMLFFLKYGYRVIAHDRRGHGRSTQVSDGHDMDHYADDLAALTAHLDLKNAIHVGHSTGDRLGESGAKVYRSDAADRHWGLEGCSQWNFMPRSDIAVMVDGLSRREAAKRFGVHRNTITKMLSFSVPPGYRRRERPASKKLGPYLAWIDAILEGDSQVHKKQRHTAHRIFERLRDEQGFTGGYTIVREYVAAEMLRTREMFVPLSHRPGHAQADFALHAGQDRIVLRTPVTATYLQQAPPCTLTG